MGNLRSVQKAFERVGASAQIVTTPEQIARAEKVVLPGVGAFRDAIGALRTQDLVEPVREAIDSGRPFLGICLGLQLLFDVSYEDGEYAGLGVLPGKVVRFDFSGLPGAADLKIPQMGWNQLHWTADCPILSGINPGMHFYFVHSYHVVPAEIPAATGGDRYSADRAATGGDRYSGDRATTGGGRYTADTATAKPGGRDAAEPTGTNIAAPRRALNVATCHYGYDFAAMVWRDNLYATQFHPEKSQTAGLKLLENFTRLAAV